MSVSRSRYADDAARDAKCFAILQSVEPRIAQSFFWNFSSRAERREAILAWKADQEMNSKEHIVSMDTTYEHG